ncbi:MAG: hypothetical protein KDJ54_18815 [Candidatus Competibacteraceae bacterium]|nr:hypothetical protein [Candidatus Competibacteraceae bacterium]
MTITVTELQRFKDSMVYLSQLRSIPLEVIEFYLENERGYIIKESEPGDEKTVVVQPPRSQNG